MTGVLDIMRRWSLVYAVHCALSVCQHLEEEIMKQCLSRIELRIQAEDHGGICTVLCFWYPGWWCLSVCCRYGLADYFHARRTRLRVPENQNEKDDELPK